MKSLTACIAATLFAAGCAPVDTVTQRETTVRHEKNLATGATKTTTTTTVTTKEMRFSLLDADRDGYVVVTELPDTDPFTKVWVDYDADSDKRITQVEYDAWYIANVEED